MADTLINRSDRAFRLLYALVDLYIDSGEPVSSASLSKIMEQAGEAIPPSTIRLELGKLETQGYLTKPHTSGGRIPTVKAYRIYVDSIEPRPLDEKLSSRILEAAKALSGELTRLLDYAGEVLAEESGYLGFATSPSLADAKIGRIKIDPIEADTLLLRLELASGRVYHHLARVPMSIRNLRLDVLASHITERLSGRRLADISEAEIEALVEQTARWGQGYGIFIHPLHELITDAKLGEGPITVMHGAAGLLRASGEDPDALQRAVAFLDDRTTMERALDAVPGQKDIRVVIGGDGAFMAGFPHEISLDGLALVVASYHVAARASGRLGILGPIRMSYSRHVALVRSVSDLISRVLISRELTPRFG
jgi:heat-inducible transcriptional repressor